MESPSIGSQTPIMQQTSASPVIQQTPAQSIDQSSAATITTTTTDDSSKERLPFFKATSRIKAIMGHLEEPKKPSNNGVSRS